MVNKIEKEAKTNYKDNCIDNKMKQEDKYSCNNKCKNPTCISCSECSSKKRYKTIYYLIPAVLIFLFAMLIKYIF